MSQVRHVSIPELGKEDFLEMPVGHWLISNTLEQVGDLSIPIVMEQLPPLDERDELWEGMVGRIAGRKAYVFEHLDDARRFFGYDSMSKWGFEA